MAYIAGFLDGDGSLMLQIKKRSDGNSKLRFMLTMCFYQDTRHESGLIWIKRVLGIGYISRRNDGMTELRINGVKQVKNILKCLMPYIRFKKTQSLALYKAATILEGKIFRNLSKLDLLKIISCMKIIQDNNYVTRKKRTELELMKILGLTP